MVGVPAEGHLPHLVIEDRRTDGRTEVCPTVVCGSDSHLPGSSSPCQMMTRKTKEPNSCLWGSHGRLGSFISGGGGRRWCRFQLFAVGPGAALLHLTHVTEKMSPQAPGCLNLTAPPKDSSDSHRVRNPLTLLALTLTVR